MCSFLVVAAAAFPLFPISPKSRRKRLDWKFFLPPLPSIHPSHREWISSSLSAAKKERLFFSLSLFFPLEKERGEGRTGLVVERKAKVFTAVRYGEHQRCPGTVVVEGFSKETYGGLYSVYTRGRLKSIFPARSGPHRTKPGGTMDRPMCTLAGHENNGWNCSRFNTDLFPFPAR